MYKKPLQNQDQNKKIFTFSTCNLLDTHVYIGLSLISIKKPINYFLILLEATKKAL